MQASFAYERSNAMKINFMFSSFNWITAGEMIFLKKSNILSVHSIIQTVHKTLCIFLKYNSGHKINYKRRMLL